MKTTELFIEQLIIGILVVSTGIALGIGPVSTSEWFTSLKDVNEIVKGAAFFALAYPIGILFDRVADTLLEGAYQHMVLVRANPNFETHSKKDPFPLHKYHMKVMKEKSDIVEHAGYLRHRMRILRSVVVLLPAMTIAILLHKIGENAPWSGAMIIIIATYAALFGWQLLRLLLRRYSIGERETRTKNRKTKKWVISHPLLFLFAVPPKTNCGSTVLSAYYKNSKHWFLRIVYLIQEPVFLLMWVLYYYSSNITRDPGNGTSLIPLIIIFGTAFVVWAWWRVSRTFLKFVEDFGKTSS